MKVPRDSGIRSLDNCIESGVERFGSSDLSSDGIGSFIRSSCSSSTVFKGRIIFFFVLSIFLKKK